MKRSAAQTRRRRPLWQARHSAWTAAVSVAAAALPWSPTADAAQWRDAPDAVHLGPRPLRIASSAVDDEGRPWFRRGPGGGGAAAVAPVVLPVPQSGRVPYRVGVRAVDEYGRPTPAPVTVEQAASLDIPVQGENASVPASLRPASAAPRLSPVDQNYYADLAAWQGQLKADSPDCDDSTCSGHGMCHDGWCTCEVGFAGRFCDYFIEQIVDAPELAAAVAFKSEGCSDWCSGHGSCEAGLCRCMPGWTGRDCMTEKQCVDNCNTPSGWCIDGACVCAHGFVGATCAEHICPDNCWGHGACEQGRCRCHDGWGGDRCDVQLARAPRPRPPPEARGEEPQPWDVVLNVTGRGKAGAEGKAGVEGVVSMETRGVVEQPRSDGDALPMVTSPTLEPVLAQTKASLRGSGPPSSAEERPPAATAAPTSAAAKIRAALDAAERMLQAVNPLAAAAPAALLAATSGDVRAPAAATPLEVTPDIAASTQGGGTGAASSGGGASTDLAAVVTPVAGSGPTATVADSHPCLESDPFQPCSERDYLAVRQQTTATTTTAFEPCANHCTHKQDAAVLPFVGDLAFTITVRNVDFVQLTADPALTAAFEETVQRTLATQLTDPYRGSSTSPGDISLALSPGSVIVQATVAAHTSAAATKALREKFETFGMDAKLAQAVSTDLAKLEGLTDVSTGVPTVDFVSKAVVIPVAVGENRPLLAKQEQLMPNACPDDCGGHGDCKSGVCQCSGGWTGESCDMAPCPSGCNGRGTCMRGLCVCPAAFYGDACQWDRCPNDCSGNGQCEAGVCRCDAGFTGNGCQHRPPPFAEERPDFSTGLGGSSDLGSAVKQLREMPAARCPEDCNAQGKCETDGTCTCLAGYSGVACESYCPNSCSGNGECTNSVCMCMTGYSGPDCSIRSCCSGHGSCDMPDRCVCEAGWMGDTCSVQMACSDPSCSGHGECKFGACQCDGGYTGMTCASPPSECPPCPPEGTCDRQQGICMCGPSPCPGALEAAGKPMALVADGKPLPRMAQLALNGTMQRRAFSAAPAESTYVAPTPDCNPPYGEWSDAISACVCKGAYHGKYCDQMHCPDWDPNNPDALECSGKGQCQPDGNCICGAGWGLADGKDGANICADVVCPVDCGAHGMCQENKCVCQDGWQGPACRQPKCIDDCSGHGSCAFVSTHSAAECVCEYGYQLPNCATKALYLTLPACPNDCNGNGLCFEGTCTCKENFGGLDCGIPKPPEGGCVPGSPGCVLPCPRGCSGEGTCMSGVCQCNKGRAGSDCSIPEVCMEECGEVCMANLMGQPCEICKGHCVTLLLNPVIGRHDPLAVRLSTLSLGNATLSSRAEVEEST